MKLRAYSVNNIPSLKDPILSILKQSLNFLVYPTAGITVSRLNCSVGQVSTILNISFFFLTGDESLNNTEVIALAMIWFLNAKLTSLFSAKHLARYSILSTIGNCECASLINNNAKSLSFNNHSGIYLGNDGTFYIGDEDNYIRTIAGPNDSKLLEIHVNQVYFGKSENLMDFYQQTLKENNNLNNKIDENIGVVADSITDLGQNISDITGSLNNKVDSDELLNTVTNINNSITGIQTSLNEEITNRQNGDAELLSTLSYEGYIITDNERGIIQVGKVSEDRTNYSYVRIDSGKPRSTGSSDYIPPQIVIHINDGDINEDVAYFSSEELYVPVTTTPQLHMQQRSSVGETIGKMGWIMRSNGHLSLKIV